MPQNMNREQTDRGDDAAAAGAVVAAKRELAAAILRGDYAAGQRLVEAELAATLGASRATIRSVFVALEQDNYISLEHNRGARVRSFSYEEAIEVLRAREVLESAIAGAAAERITEQECDQLAVVIERMIAANEAHDNEAWSALNREFHAGVVAAGRQPTLARFLASTPYSLVVTQFRDLGRQRPRAGALREHQAILANLRTHDAVAATEAMRYHVAAVRRALNLEGG